MLARSEALKRNTRVTVCKSADGAACTNAGNWDQGWIVFDDPNGDAAVSAGETLLFVRQDRVQGVDASGGSGLLKNYVSYIANGVSRMTDGSMQSGDIEFCRDPRPSDTSKNRTLTISVTGRPSVKKGGC
jgi:type IV fimbrial biogenesis protein FimT